MALPMRTAAERSADIEAATAARHERAELRAELKAGKTTLSEVLDRSSDPIVGRMRIETLLESLPGFGKAKAAKLMDELGISHSRRIQGLGSRQKALLLQYFAPEDDD